MRTKKFTKKQTNRRNRENYTHEIFSTAKYHDSLPDPSGLLSSSVPIAAAYQEVEEAIRTASSGKRGPYKPYNSLTVWCLGLRE